jgi:hypothetical protein
LYMVRQIIKRETTKTQIKNKFEHINRHRQSLSNGIY